MDRISELNDLKNFITEKKSFLNSILNELNWSSENLMKDSGVKLPQEEKRIIEHKPDDDEEPLFPESLEWNNSTKIDENILNRIIEKINQGNSQSNENAQIKVPNKFSDLQVNFTREQKLAIYEYVIENTKKLSEPELPMSLPSTSNDDNEKKILSFAEILALRRDMKRRRQKYRTTKNPPLSLTEEFRNLIDLHMQSLVQYLSEQNSASVSSNKEKESMEEIPHCSSSKSIRSRSRSDRKKIDKEKNDTAESPRQKKSKRSKSDHHKKGRSHHHKGHKHGKDKKSRKRSESRS